MFAFVTHVATAQCRDRITLAMKHSKDENPLDTTIGPAGELIVSFALSSALFLLHDYYTNAILACAYV